MNCKFIQIPCPDCEQLHQQLAEKEAQLAMAEDAANKGGKARNIAQALTDEVAILRAQLAKYKQKFGDIDETNI